MNELTTGRLQSSKRRWGKVLVWVWAECRRLQSNMDGGIVPSHAGLAYGEFDLDLGELYFAGLPLGVLDNAWACALQGPE